MLRKVNESLIDSLKTATYFLAGQTKEGDKMAKKINTASLPAYEVKSYIDELYYVFSVIKREIEFQEIEAFQMPGVLEVTKSFGPVEFEILRKRDNYITRIRPDHLDDYIASNKSCTSTGFLRIMESFNNFLPQWKST